MTTDTPPGPAGPWRGYDRSGPPSPPAPPGPWTGPPPAYAAGSQAPPPPQPSPLLPPPKRRSRWPLVLGIVAGVVLLAGLVVGLVAMVQMITSDFGGDIDDPPVSESSLTGQLPASHQAGTGLTGAQLQDIVTPIVEDDYGGDVDWMTCPATPKVDQNVTTVCHGSVDGDSMTAIVFFEDQAGHYTVLTTY